MSTSSTTRSSSSSGTVRSAVERHLPAIKELPAIPKKTAKPSSPRLSLANERKVLRRLKKKAITKTAKGSIAKVRRRYPGTSSLCDTSSEGSVSSGRSRKLKLQLGAKLDGNLGNANSGTKAAKLDVNLGKAKAGTKNAKLDGNASSEDGFAVFLGMAGSSFLAGKYRCGSTADRTVPEEEDKRAVDDVDMI